MTKPVDELARALLSFSDPLSHSNSTDYSQFSLGGMVMPKASPIVLSQMS